MKINVLITPEMLNLIAEIDEFKGAWEALETLTPERLDALRKVATIESVGSSTRIEGAKLTDKQVAGLLSNLKISSFDSRDEQEVAGYAEVMGMVSDHWKNISITENHIKQLHGALLQYTEKDVRHRGEYKKFPNHVEAFDETGKSLGIVFKTATPFDTPRKMSELLVLIQCLADEGKLHSLLVIAIFVVIFLAIHPFQDGNGRLSRALTMLVLLRFGYHYVPYLSLEHIIEENKEQYYQALQKTQSTLEKIEVDWTPWIIFFLNMLKEHKIRLQSKIEKERILIQSLPKLSLEIIKYIKAHGSLTLDELHKLTQRPKSTIKLHLRKLCDKKKLTLHKHGRGSWYDL